jgi:hypothetical protein
VDEELPPADRRRKEELLLGLRERQRRAGRGRHPGERAIGRMIIPIQLAPKVVSAGPPRRTAPGGSRGRALRRPETREHRKPEYGADDRTDRVARFAQTLSHRRVRFFAVQTMM